MISFISFRNQLFTTMQMTILCHIDTLTAQCWNMSLKGTVKCSLNGLVLTIWRLIPTNSNSFAWEKGNDSIKSFNIASTEINCEDNVTLLGDNIAYLSKFDYHVSDICKKKLQDRWQSLKRIGNFLTKQGRMIIYNSFILSNFNYCPIVWNFCSKRSSDKMEKLQERGLRVVTDDYSYPINVILEQTKSKLLHVNRIQTIAKEAYKILNKDAPFYLHDFLSFKHNPYNSRRQKQIEVPQVNTTRYRLKSFRYEATRIWNSLPNDIHTVESTFG